ncbi:MAG: hypothetical protein ABI651_13995 [Verrucomicrobiota bacterium]
MPATTDILELRQLLAQRFPHLRTGARVAPPTETLATGVGAFDVLLEGGLPRGQFTELVGAGHGSGGSGSAQVIHSLLRRTAADGQFLALVDGADSFDVSAVEPDVLAHLLWVRCTNAGDALKAADLLLRDNNFPLVAIDLKLNSVGQLRKISSSIWYRLGRILEQSRTAVLVVTPHALVSGVAWRVQVESGLGIEALMQSPEELVPQLRFMVLRSALAPGEAMARKAG